MHKKPSSKIGHVVTPIGIASSTLVGSVAYGAAHYAIIDTMSHKTYLNMIDNYYFEEDNLTPPIPSSGLFGMYRGAQFGVLATIVALYSSQCGDLPQLSTQEAARSLGYGLVCLATTSALSGVCSYYTAVQKRNYGTPVNQALNSAEYTSGIVRWFVLGGMMIHMFRQRYYKKRTLKSTSHFKP